MGTPSASIPPSKCALSSQLCWAARANCGQRAGRREWGYKYVSHTASSLLAEVWVLMNTQAEHGGEAPSGWFLWGNSCPAKSLIFPLHSGSGVSHIAWESLILLHPQSHDVLGGLRVSILGNTASQDCCAHAQRCCLCCSLCSSPLSSTGASTLYNVRLCTDSVTAELCCTKDVERCYLFNINKCTLDPCTCNNYFASAYSYTVEPKLQKPHPKMV